MTRRIRASALALVAALGLAGCGTMGIPTSFPGFEGLEDLVDQAGAELDRARELVEGREDWNEQFGDEWEVGDDELVERWEESSTDDAEYTTIVFKTSNDRAEDMWTEFMERPGAEGGCAAELGLCQGMAGDLGRDRSWGHTTCESGACQMMATQDNGDGTSSVAVTVEQRR